MTLESSLDVQVGDDEVEFELAVENTGPDPVELTFRSGLKADFAVKADGREVWRASDGRMFTQAIESETVPAGETVTFPGAWPDPEPGSYSVVAELKAGGRNVTARAEFTV